MDGLAEKVCKEELGEAPERVVEIDGGLMSRTFSLDCGDKSFVLQITSESEPHELENCVKSFRFFEGSNVPVPAPVTDGIKELESNHYVMVEKLPGEVLGEDLDQEIMKLCGRHLAYIHSSRDFQDAGWIEWNEDEPEVIGFPGGSLRSRVRQLMEERLEFFRENNIDWLARVTERFLQEHVQKVPLDFEPVFVHHDFNPGNIMVKEGEIVGILDFDYAHSSHAQRDLAKAANKFWLRGGKREWLYSGYKEARKLENSFEENKKIYLLETLIDELAGMLQLDHKTVEEINEYQNEIDRLEKELEN